MVFGSVKAMVMFFAAHQFPPFGRLLQLLIPKPLKERNEWHHQYVVRKA
jgi:hypothetical protein